MKTIPIPIARRTGLWLAVLTSLPLLVPPASAAVSITEDPDSSGPCIWRSGSWVSDIEGGNASLYEVNSDGCNGCLFEYFDFTISIGNGNNNSLLPVFGGIYGSGEYDVSIFSRVADAADGSFDFVTSSGRWSLAVSGSFLGDPKFGGVWTGTYKVTGCDPHDVHDSGASLALLGVSLGAIGGLRRVMAKRRRA